MDRFNKNKNIILGVTTLLITISFSTIGLLKDIYIIIDVIFGVLCSLFYVAALYYFSKREAEINDALKIIDQIKLNKEAFETMVRHMKAITQFSAVMLQKILQDRKNANNWDFGSMCQKCCDAIYLSIIALKNNELNISVSYITMCNKGNMVVMNACKNKYDVKPHIYKQNRIINTDGFYDLKLFIRNNSEYEILLTQEEINSRFQLKKEGKYEQYIAIPVMDDNNNMIGLLQIIVIGKMKLGDNKEDINDLIISYVKPYTPLFALFFQIDKWCIGLKDGENHE